ncbi:MAG TPA: lysophospholipid acyltransferase family protein [bacterium]|uniref:1-acyl-sn-glycerol-3-phosphate acyltransferase n=1 Tax=candidate division TA06 bacterium ADurb.Bin417 TaxID=1852828 RepID=A0A1V5MGH6_UNCT6|nr:MAG: 1-acyl-sn-glycerol-3-phosphate acyltransferase [candidate division TA06 bacterium ADurb.Bin417]HNQ34856.1 lysophospholipid acyltransferase family protein [bacterium]HNS48722.1 lysophospholipid acyltransferase family protein [bacterium]
MFYKFLKSLLNIFCLLFFRLEVRGVENIPRRGGAILASNHLSLLDPPLVALRIPRRIRFLSKTVLYRNSLLEPIIKSLGIIPLRQHSGAVGLKSVIRSLKSGHAVLIFPEGSRNPNGSELLPGQPGITLAVRATGVPVVPVLISGTEKALPLNAVIFRPRKVLIRYGPPLLYRGEADFADRVMAAIDRLRPDNPERPE